MTNKISVVIPTHNRIAELCKSIESILRQTELPNELIVVDDGSQPPVDKSIFSTLAQDINCKLIRVETPHGANYARNLGIEAAQGEFISFLDDDDEFKENKIQVLSESINENIDVDIYYHPAEIHMVNENIVYFSRPKKFSPFEDVFRSLLISNRVGGTPMVTVRKEALINVGLFDEGMPAQQDYELWLRLAKGHYIFKMIDFPLTKYHYVTNKKSISKDLTVNLQAVALIENKYIKEYLKLSKSEKKEYDERKNKNLVHKFLLNGQVFKAFRFQTCHFIQSPKPKNLLAMIAIVIGPRFVYKMKSKFGGL